MTKYGDDMKKPEEKLKIKNGNSGLEAFITNTAESLTYFYETIETACQNLHKKV